jgi:GAF domain-containing protein
MLAHAHRLKVDQEGIVGYVAGKGEPRIALDVGSDAVFFNNPDLPETRSEMALPLKARQQVIGVLDVQSTEEAAFTQEDIDIIQILADQIALAIENARLLQESQQALQELEKLYRQQVGQAWQKRLSHKTITYTYNPLGVEASPIQAVNSAVGISMPDSGPHGAAPNFARNGHTLNTPITLRSQSIGSLMLRREIDQAPWSQEEIELVNATLSQLALALENARLIEENSRRAQNEQLIGKIAAQAQSSLDLEILMKRTVKEIGQALGAGKVQIRLGVDPKDRHDPSSNGGSA